MRKLFCLSALFALTTLQAQDISDAMRFSQENLSGTARFRAMSGAFGALGGDLSAIGVNPAGSAVFSNNQAGVTFTNYSSKNNSDYFGRTSESTDDKFTVNQGGAVFVFEDRNPNSANTWKKVALAFNYDNTSNLNNTIFSTGVNPTNSLANYFLSHANGVPLNALESSNYEQLDYGTQQAFLGYQSYMINPVDETDPNNTAYSSNVASGGKYYQENRVYHSGYTGKYTANVATSYNDRLFLGLNLNLHAIDYKRSSTFYEENSNQLDANYRVTSASFENHLYTYGAGFSFQLGAIAKVTEALRLGLTYDSNTWYTINDELTQYMIARSSNNTGSLNPDEVNPRVTNIYDPYKLQTPGKFTGSIAYIFGKSGLLSIDYAIRDYSNTKFKPQYDSYYEPLNNQMSKLFNRSSGELRIGGEYRINQFSLRGGYRFEESPYKNGKTIGDLSSYSAGIGYNFGSTKLDIAYSYAKRDSQMQQFTQGLTDVTTINSKFNNVAVSLLFEL